MGSIPGLGRSPGGGNGNPLQYSCLGNPVDRGDWWATVHGVTKSRIQLGTHVQMFILGLTCKNVSYLYLAVKINSAKLGEKIIVIKKHHEKEALFCKGPND